MRRLKSGEWVVVKVRHAGIEEIIRRDLEILTGLAPWAERVPEFANYRPRATVAEFQRTLRRELGFWPRRTQPATVRASVRRRSTVRIPRSYPDLSTARVLTMEYLEGMKLSQTEKLHEAGLRFGGSCPPRRRFVFENDFHATAFIMPIRIRAI